MKCPKCGKGKLFVSASEHNRHSDYMTVRLRECRKCGETFHTVERMDIKSLNAVIKFKKGIA